MNVQYQEAKESVKKKKRKKKVSPHLVTVY